MMRRHLARTILASDPRPGTLRPFLVALLALFAIPASAQACAMYIPEDVEVQLMVRDDQPVGLDQLFAIVDGEAETTVARREEIEAMVKAGPLAGLDATLRTLGEATGTRPFLRAAVIGTEAAAVDAKPQS